jgi:hypothetical protein
MKIPKLKKHDPVDLRWIDIYDPALSSWASDEEIAEAIEKGATEANSRGYFYCEEEGYLYFYSDKLDDKYSRLTGIPRGCITHLKKQSYKKKRST